MSEEDIISVYIPNKGDHISFKYNKKTKKFIWSSLLVETTTPEWRKEYENNFKLKLKKWKTKN